VRGTREGRQESISRRAMDRGGGGEEEVRHGGEAGTGVQGR